MMGRLDISTNISIQWFFSSVFMISFAMSIVLNYTADNPPGIEQRNVTQSPFSDPLDMDDDDVVEKFLELVEKYEKNKENCTAGTQVNLGEGVIQQYGINRFKLQGMVAVNRANFLTRIWKEAPKELLDSEYFFYTQVRSMVEGDPEIFAAGNCYDNYEFKDYYLFCPYGYRMENGQINVKDLSVEYDFLGNDSEWFYSARLRSKRVELFNYTIGTYNLSTNKTNYLQMCCPHDDIYD